MSSLEARETQRFTNQGESNRIESVLVLHTRKLRGVRLGAVFPLSCLSVCQTAYVVDDDESNFFFGGDDFPSIPTT